MNNRTLFDYAILAESSYADFSRGNFSKDVIIDSIMKTDEGRKPKPKIFAELVVEQYQIAAHYKDRIDESSFSGTLFKRSQPSGHGNVFLS